MRIGSAMGVSAYPAVRHCLGSADLERNRHERVGLARLALFAFIGILVCPFRYFSVESMYQPDGSWVYALNVAAVQNRQFGVDLFWTTGPLAYLFYPLDSSPYLWRALIAQALVWAGLLVIIALPFFRLRFPLLRLGSFCVCIALASPWFHLNYMGVENLLLTAFLLIVSLLLLEECVGPAWFCVLLVLAPLLFLIKATAGAMAIGALAGYHLAALRSRNPRALAYSALSVVCVPLFFILEYWAATGSVSVEKYCQGTIEISKNFSVAMSIAGPLSEQLRAAAVVLILIGLIASGAIRHDRGSLLLMPFALPLFVSFRHGFVRQDVHTINFFCFVSLLLGIYLLFLDQHRFDDLFCISAALLLVISTASVLVRLATAGELVGEASGWANVKRLWSVASVETGGVSARTQRKPEASEPLNQSQMKAVDGAPIAVVSPDLISWPLDQLNLDPLPVVQGYQACTPYLDRMNAGWLATKGPHQVLLQWLVLDGRHPLGNPATLLSMYQWFDTELAGPSSVLLRRRSSPRFTHLESIVTYSQATKAQINMPGSSELIFLRVHLGLNVLGKTSKLLYRVPEVDMTMVTAQGENYSHRIVPELLESPLLVSELPGSLEGVAQLFAGGRRSVPHIDHVYFAGPGLDYYDGTMNIQLSKPNIQVY